MDEAELRDLLRGRLYIELQLFKDRLLRQDKEIIYQSAYEIEICTDIYEVLQEDMEEMRGSALRALLHQESGIIQGIYYEWLVWEDGFYEEFRKYVREKAGIERKIDTEICGEEVKADGHGYDKAA